MDQIPMPELLDPERMLINDRGNLETTEFHRHRADLLERGLRQSCDYAQELWTTLDELRRYLLDYLPPDPRSPEADRISARPTGPDDEEGWQGWMDAYAAVHSVLAGPHGDSGHGRHEAKREAHWRRSAPLLMGAEADGRHPRPVARGLSGALRRLRQAG